MYGTLANPNNWPIPPNRDGRHFSSGFDAPLVNGAVMPITCGVGIGDYVWHDVNANGIQDAGEPGINGVSLILRDENGNAIATTTTDVGPMNQQGYYQFEEIIGFCAGTWTVEVDPATVPSGFIPTTVNAGGSNSTNDSNASPSTVVLATDISEDQTHDFGFRAGCDGRIGDFLWHDLDRDGIQDAGEPGLGGVTVNLLRASDGTLVATTTTDGSGKYQFTGLCDENYIVSVDEGTLPAGFVPTAPGASGSTVDTDSNGSPAAVSLSPGHRDDPSIDFGYITPCTSIIGDFLWYDVNQNGVQDAGEPGIDGATVKLVDDASGVVLQTTTSGPSGAYQFTGVCAGTYRVQVDESTLPPQRSATVSGAGAADVDSNPNPSLVVIGDNATDTTIDFGYIAPCTGRIGDFVWRDENQNGIQDAGEAGFAGVTVNLRRASDNSVIQTEVTGADGAYMFEGLCPGSYIVEAVPPAGATQSPVGQGNPANDSNPNMFGVTLGADNSADLTVDFGFYGTGEIGDFVWRDTNGNGVQDAGEPGIAGVTVRLTDSHGHVLVTATDAGGHYLFTGLSAGDFTVTVTAPAGYLASPSLAGGDPARDSNGSPAAVTLHDNNSVDYSIDFGYVPGSLSGYAYKDLNKNMSKDAGEPGIGGVTITLAGVGTTTTAPDGFYMFGNLAANTYSVSAPATAAGLTLHTPNPLSVVLPAGQHRPNNNFGYIDNTKPVCAVYASAKPPYMSYQDAGSGIVKLEVTTNLYNNFSVTITPSPTSFTPALTQPFPMPAGTIAHFSTPTNELIKASAVRINTTEGAQLTIKATDAFGNWVSCDPVETTVTKLRHERGIQTFTEIPFDEHIVTITNGAPGLRALDVVVNGVTFKARQMDDNEVRVINIRSAMHRRRDNTITLIPRGKPGDSADVVIGPPE